MTATIISGASRGIGKAIFEDLQNLGHRFIPMSTMEVDLSDYIYTYYYTKSQIEEVCGQVNIILCAAQIGTCNSDNLQEIEKLYKINVLGNLAIIMAVRECTNKDTKLRIVWFAGGGAAFPYPEFMGYSLSKVAVVRAVENLSIKLKESYNDVSIIALAPGAVETDMLKKVTDAGVQVRTKTDISEPVVFVRKFITDEFDSPTLNGKFLHVRDTLNIIHRDMFQLRRIE